MKILIAVWKKGMKRTSDGGFNKSTTIFQDHLSQEHRPNDNRAISVPLYMITNILSNEIWNLSCILANIAGSLDPDYHGVTLRQ